MIWRLIPCGHWPVFLATSTFPIFSLHQFFRNIFRLFDLNGFGIVHCSERVYLLGIWFILEVVSVLILTFLLRRFLPRAAGILFGDR